MDASNTDRFPENQAPSTVNNGARALEGIIARYFFDNDTSIEGTLSGSVIQVTASRNSLTLTGTTSNYVANFMQSWTQGATANPSPCSLNIDGVGPIALRDNRGVTLSSSVILAGTRCLAVKDNANNYFRLIWPHHQNETAGDTLTTEGDIIYHDASGLQRLAIGTATQQLAVNSGATAPEWVSAAQLVQKVVTETGAVGTTTTNLPVDDTIPQNTEGAEFMTRTITPNAAGNDLYITVVVHFESANGTAACAAALFKDATANALAASVVNPGGTGFTDCIVFKHKVAAGSTSLQTFKVRAGAASGAGVFTFNGASSARLFGGVIASSITIEEVIP